MIERAKWRVLKPTASPAPATVEGLLEEGADALPVRITIHQDRFCTGWDDGALGFDDGAVWFSGRCCSFRIAVQDFHFDPKSRGWMMFFPVGRPTEILLRHSARRVCVQLAVLRTSTRDHETDTARLSLELMRLHDRGSPGSVSDYPPLAPRPGVKAELDAWQQASVVLSFLLLLACAVGTFLVDRLFSAGLGVSIFFFLLAVSLVAWADRASRRAATLKHISAEVHAPLSS